VVTQTIIAIISDAPVWFGRSVRVAGRPFTRLNRASPGPRCFLHRHSAGMEEQHHGSPSLS